MKAPQGGPSDKTPPKVLKMLPDNFSTNFKGNKIIIEFDEYYNLQNEFKEFSISPEQEKPPLLKKNKKKLEINFQDTLEKNTTYTLNFGKAIVDVNEGNVLKNFTYVFSTGDKLDSLSIRGTVTNTATGKPEFDATVFLIPIARDSIFGLKKPTIFTNTDSSGRYSLNNLRENTYSIYAIKENEGGDKIYQQINDQVAFRKDSIVLTKNIDSINLELFKENAQQFRIIEKKINNDGSLLLVFNQQLISPKLSFIDHKNIDENKLIRFSKTNDTVKIWPKDLEFDSVKVAIINDGKAIDTVNFSRDKKDVYTRTITLTDNSNNSLVNPFRTYKIFFNQPIKDVDLSKIKLLEDSIPRTNFSLEKDSTDLLAYNFVYPWKYKSNYILTFTEGTFTDIYGTKNKEIKRLNKLDSKDEYATLTVNVEIPDTTKTYIIELLNEKKNVVNSKIVIKNEDIIYDKYRAGIYFIRVIYDTNKNGKWDTGNVKNKTQPEKIYYPTDEYSMKANWTRTQKLIIPRE